MRITAAEYRKGKLPKAPRGLQCGGRRAQPEANLQRAVMQFLRAALPEDAVPVCYPLGGGGYRHGTRAKSLGAMKGFPDIFVIHRGSIFGLELKSLRGQLGVDQRIAHERLGRAGMPVVTCRSVDEVQAALSLWEIPNRAPVFGWVARKLVERGKIEHLAGDAA
jgi:hypothetical protein